ncbi:MAG: hypothetical protein ACLFV6_05650 [Spirulinaceae cyanobacterium]
MKLQQSNHLGLYYAPNGGLEAIDSVLRLMSQPGSSRFNRRGTIEEIAQTGKTAQSV